MRFNVNGLVNNFFKNPTGMLLVVAAFGVGFYVAKRFVLKEPVTAFPAVPQYQSESEVQYPRRFGGNQDENTYWEYTEPANFDSPDIMGLEDNGSNVPLPRISNSFYSAEDIITDDDAYFYAQDAYADVQDY